MALIRLPIPATDDMIAIAREFVLRMWRQRTLDENERRAWCGMEINPVPEDLSNSCKFSSMFARAVFGGKLAGNSNHQFVLLDGAGILDLNGDADDVQAMLRAFRAGAGPDPYRHDRAFFGNADHRRSMRDCEPRVRSWVAAFKREMAAELLPERAAGADAQAAPTPVASMVARR